MFDEIIDLFSDDAESVEIMNSGVYLGKKGAKRIFKGVLGAKTNHPKLLALHMQLQDVVDLDLGGKTAKGRWRCFYCLATPVKGELSALWGHGEYEKRIYKRGWEMEVQETPFLPYFSNSV